MEMIASSNHSVFHFKIGAAKPTEIRADVSHIVLHISIT